MSSTSLVVSEAPKLAVCGGGAQFFVMCTLACTCLLAFVFLVFMVGMLWDVSNKIGAKLAEAREQCRNLQQTVAQLELDRDNYRKRYLLFRRRVYSRKG